MSRPATGRGPGRPPGSDGEKTRLEILHSARQVFSTTGFDRASLKQIAEDAGFTRNAIVNYYTSKMELYGAALDSVHDVVVGRILDDARAQAGSVHRRVMAVFEAAVGFSHTDPTFVQFFVTSTADAIHHPELRDQALLPIASVSGYLQDLLDTAAQAGQLDPTTDTEATVQVCMDLLWGLAMDIGYYSDASRTRRTLQALDRIMDAALTPTGGTST